MNECHCGKDGYPLHSVSCGVHGASARAARLVDEWSREFDGDRLTDWALGELMRRIAQALAGREVPDGSDDETIMHRNVSRLHESDQTLALRVSREHYLWLADRISELSRELSHFANRA